MKFSKPIIAITICLALASCGQGRDKETVGTLAGAGIGGLIGTQLGGGKGKLAAVVLGTLAGAWAGSEVGKSLDKADKAYAQRTAQDALEYNKAKQPSTWRNPDSGKKAAAPIAKARLKIVSLFNWRFSRCRQLGDRQCQCLFLARHQ